MPPERPKSTRLMAAGRASRPEAASGGQDDLGEVYFEFRPVGTYMRVAAIHANSGKETFVLGPLNASRAGLQTLALRKLKTLLQTR